MSHARRLLLSASYFQSIAASSRHQLRIRRRPVQFSSQHRIERLFTSQTRLRQDEPVKENGKEAKSKDDGAATLPEETTEIARAADEPPKLSDLEEVPGDITPEQLAEAATHAFDAEEVGASQFEGTSKDDGAATLAEETTEIARAADEPAKPSDTEGIPEDVPPFELAEATTQAIDAGEIASSEKGGIAKYFGEESGDAGAVEVQGDANADVETANIIPHGTSEEHQDLREYARLAAWELPLLHKLKKPFTPPTTSTPLRFRYTSYLGDSHPASRKVVLEFKPSELPGLNESQTIKLIKLAGTRYNPEKQLIKMSSESFETPAQNKRYLGDLVQKLVKEAKDGKDTLEDIPVDLRHHKQKPIYKFPEEWKIERPARIEQGKRLRGKGGRKRQVIQRLEQSGQLVDGERVVREAMAAVPVARLGRPDGQKTVLGTRTGKAPVKGRPTSPTSW